MRRGPSRIDHVVDVPGTIRRITEEDLWEPVLRPAQERWLSLSLVVDVARSMDLWRPAARELGRVLGQMGSFARVHLWSWDTQNGDLALSPALQGPIPGNTRARPSELGDPSGPHLVIVLTDCVADAWENGKAAVRLADWSSDAHLVLAQILPEWLWNRTGLATALRVRVHSLWPFAPTSTLQVVPADPVVAMILRKRGAGKGETQVALPIVTFDPEPLARWAKAAAARQDSWVPGRSWQLSPPGKLGSAPSVKKQPPRADSTEDGEQLVPRFLAVATENARKLARLLAAAPVISLPVVRLVRDSMLPEARLVHEAEVLLSGLLNVVDNPPGADPEEVRYEFREGVRAQLLKSLPAPVAHDVLEVLSDYVDQHLGQAGRFKTILADPIATPGVIDPGENPIARVAAEILLRLGGDFARLVKVRKTSSREGGASRAIGKKRAVPPIHQVPRRVAWGLKRLGIPELWKQGLTGKGILVGHLDTGVDGDHPALKAPSRHFAEFDPMGDPVPGAQPHDSGQHGTHTAGTIAGRRTRSTAFGVAPEAMLASAIVIEGGNVVARILVGMDWLAGVGVRVMNISLGLRGSQAEFLPALRQLEKRGILVVSAVGNEGPGTSRSPGNYSEVLSVGACDNKDNVADFSSSQQFAEDTVRRVPHLVAPGVDLLSCIPGGGYAKFSGTAICTPLISGLAALLFEVVPTATGQEVKDAILESCELAPGMSPERTAEESPTGRVPWRSCCRKPGEKGKPRNSHGGDRLSVSKYLLLLRSPFPKDRACPENQFQ